MSKLIRLPGLIDIHVHLRDPGETHKEDFYTGTSAALAGGVTTVFDMPTKSFHVLSAEELDTKIKTVSQKALCNWGLYFGTDGKNIREFSKIKDKVIGLKIYLNMTTGHTLISEEMLEDVFANWPKEKPIVIHSEENKIQRVISLAEKYGNKIHITHVNTKSLLNSVILAKKKNIRITCDVTPHHLFLTDKKVETMGGFGMVKPPIATQEDADYLWNNLDKIDCIATDHAPHTTLEKKSDNPPTGMPGLETTLPLLLTAVKESRIMIDDVVRLTNTNPQKIFNIKQSDDTYIEVDLDEKYQIKNENLKTKCGWSPFDGWEVYGRIKNVFIRGTKVFEDGEILIEPGFGRNVI